MKEIVVVCVVCTDWCLVLFDAQVDLSCVDAPLNTKQTIDVTPSLCSLVSDWFPFVLQSPFAGVF